MRKILALLTALIMVFTLAACASDEINLNSLQLFRLMKSGTVSFDYAMEVEGMDATGTLALDGDKMAMTMTMDGEMLGLGDESMTIRIIVKDYMGYMVFDDMEAVMEMPLDELDMLDLFEEFLVSSDMNLVQVDSGTAEINGKTLTYIDYIEDDDGEVGRIFIENGEVYALASADADEFVMFVSNVSANVSAALFEIPEHYMDFMEMFMGMF